MSMCITSGLDPWCSAPMTQHQWQGRREFVDWEGNVHWQDWRELAYWEGNVHRQDRRELADWEGGWDWERESKGIESRKVKGSVVLMNKNSVLWIKNIIASFIDRIYELLGQRVSMQLISSVHPDPGHSFSNNSFYILLELYQRTLSWTYVSP